MDAISREHIFILVYVIVSFNWNTVNARSIGGTVSQIDEVTQLVSQSSQTTDNVTTSPQLRTTENESKTFIYLKCFIKEAVS